MGMCIHANICLYAVGLLGQLPLSCKHVITTSKVFDVLSSALIKSRTAMTEIIAQPRILVPCQVPILVPYCCSCKSKFNCFCSASAQCQHENKEH